MDVGNVDPGRVTLRPTGEVDLSTVDDFDAALTEALGRPGLAEVVVDLADVDFLDSSGVRVLVQGVTRARQRGVTLRVTDPQPLVARVLRITAVGPMLGLDEDAGHPDGRGWRGLG
ncbi:STAS domain-containing protein [Micromonospora sp. BQ11]|uniref:STAS domain-containing protein n=1 Tax=Micromonospora sp. BQ11 TaxID=3452212 RepID=UPI003F8C3CEC